MSQYHSSNNYTRKILDWKNKEEQGQYITQLLDYRNKKRHMKPQFIITRCWICNNREIETRFLDRQYYCEDCKQTVIILRQRAHYKKRGGYTKYGREYKKEYQRKWSRINHEKAKKSRRVHREKFGRPPKKPIDRNSWQGVIRRWHTRRHGKKSNWFKPIKERLIKKCH